MWKTLALMAQTLFYLAATVALILLMVWSYQANERIQREGERRQALHEQMLKEHQDALEEHERIMQGR